MGCHLKIPHDSSATTVRISVLQVSIDGKEYATHWTCKDRKFPGRVKGFIAILNPSDRVWFPTSLQLSGYRAVFSPGQKRQGREDKHPHIETRLEMSGVVPHYFSCLASCPILKMCR